MNQNKIKILSKEEAIKIAAGEVVERPCNIIKELLENSIDALATKIIITVKQAGKLLIKIDDNGCGMSIDDLKICTAQHATSKISSIDDLEKVSTFGFRGEALSSIASVSNLTIRTKQDSDQSGTQIKWTFGSIADEQEVAKETGTTIEIEDLFDNIPARKKFLKKDETEWRSIIALFQAFSLDYKNVHFQLYNENKLHYNCPPVEDLQHRIAQLWDFKVQDKMIAVNQMENSPYGVVGAISNTTYYRYDRNQIFIFVNNRWVKNIDLTKAIMRGYAGTLPPQKFPASFIFITIDPLEIDVNIHPKKEEIKFLHPRKVETAITKSIKATLEQQLNHQIATTVQEEHVNPFNPVATIPQPLQWSPSPQPSTPKSFSKPNQEEVSFTPPQSAAPLFDVPKKSVEKNDFQQDEIIIQTKKHFNILCQYKKTYILLEQETNLILIDQHAAHERILYEQFKSNFKNVATVQLMFPQIIDLDKNEIKVIENNILFFKNHGIIAETFSETQLIVQATPVHLKNQPLDDIIKQIVEWISQENDPNNERISETIHEKIHTKMACSSAIKAGDVLNQEQMQKLIADLSITENKFSCPHGRPTNWILSLEEIEKKFKRDYGKKADQYYDFL